MPASLLSSIAMLVPKFESANLTTSTANVLWSYQQVGVNYKINSIQLTNYSSANANAVVGIFDYSTNSIVNIANTLVLRNNVTSVANINTNLMLEPGDALYARCDSNNRLNIFVQYDIISDLSQSFITSVYTTASNNGTLI